MKALAIAAVMLSLVSCASANRCPASQVQQQARNKQLVIGFYDELFNRHNLEAIDQHLSEDYRQHNPMVASGRQAVRDAFRSMFVRFPQYSAQIRRVAADGDLVWIHAHIRTSPEDRGLAVVDIFRVENGKIVEHWDVVQPVPQRAANDNTMF